MDISKIYGDYNKQLQEQIAQAQAQAQPQGGVLSQVDPNWLALAQGFLSPTKTGGFGESLGNAASALQGPLAKMKEQQMSAQDRINKLREMQMRLALETYRAQKGGADGGDDLNDEYKRALALSHYGNMIEKLRQGYVDPTGEFKSPQHEADYNARVKPIQSMMERLQTINPRGNPSGNPAIRTQTEVNPPTYEALPRQGGFPAPRNTQEYNLIPEGERYMSPDGQIRKKPRRNAVPEADLG